MKANAPEKIHIQPNAHDRWFECNIPKGLPDGLFVEYTRTEAFVEKTCEFIRKGGNRGDAYIVTEFGEEVFDFVQLAEDFKNYIKGQ